MLTIKETITSAFILALKNSDLTIEAVRLYSPGQETNVVKGVLLSLTPGEKNTASKTDYIDLDELSGLIKSLDYTIAQLPKLDKALSPEFRYMTKSGLRIGEFIDHGTNAYGFIQSGNTSIYLSADNMIELRDNLTKLQTALNSPSK